MRLVHNLACLLAYTLCVHVLVIPRAAQSAVRYPRDDGRARPPTQGRSRLPRALMKKNNNNNNNRNMIPQWQEPHFGRINNDKNLSDVNLAVILPFEQNRPFSLKYVSPSIQYAFEDVERLQLLPSHYLRARYADSKCNSKDAPIQAFQFYMHSMVNVFLGPVCDYSLAPVARYSPYWDVPTISPGGLAADFGKEKEIEYPLLTRVGATFNSLAIYMVNMLDAFKFAKVKILYTTEGNKRAAQRYCYLSTSAFVSKLRNEQKFEYHLYLFPDEQEEDWAEVLQEEIGIKYAVIVLCASPDSVRNIMIKAAELGFDNGEYVFFNIDLFSSKNQSEQPWHRDNDTQDRNRLARQAYEALMTVTLRKPDSLEYKKFSEEVKRRAQQQYGNFTYGKEEVNSFVGAFHDAVILYAIALNETLAAGYNATDGAEITKRMWNRSFEGITGTVSIDENGDRNADYSLLDFNPRSNKFEVVANYYGNRKKYEPVKDKIIFWPGGRHHPPPDTPKCGFDGSGCPSKEPFPEYAIVIIVLGSLLLLVSLTAFFVYRHYRLEAELAEVNWRVRWDDIMFGAMEKRKLERSGSRMSLTRRMSLQSNISGDTIAVHLSDLGNKQVFTKTGYYKGTLVAIKKINRTNINISKPLLMEFKRMRDLQNDHMVRFIGACIDPPNQCILTEYCQKGSLQDVLENDQIKLDSMFKFSLMQDIVRGMAYLHSSEIRSHGNLKSSNCVVDSRFVLKITDFGLNSLRGQTPEMNGDDSYVYYKGRLWTAPELLRLHSPPAEGTQKGDVYSFAIICQEIVYRSGPFWVESMDLTPQEIYRKVKNGQKPYFRPTLDHLDNDDCSEALATMIKRCWAEEPLDRPDFHSLKSLIRKINEHGDSGNILDNLLSRMEQYANNLEALVEERTSDYLEQKKRAEDLLYLMLPKSIAGQLMRGESVTPERFPSVSIYFSDICGFTALSAESTPEQVVDLLNDLYTTFDTIISEFDVYKVETIGDAYMVVSGLPMRNGDNHAREIARMSLALLNAVKSFKIRHRPDVQLRLRIGVHSGPVVAGVVGHKMPRYCLFGDTVNTASRMESNGEPLRIHISPWTAYYLCQFGTFVLKVREEELVYKGKGKITTWWLMGENNEQLPDLAPPDDGLNKESFC